MRIYTTECDICKAKTSVVEEMKMYATAQIGIAVGSYGLPGNSRTYVPRHTNLELCPLCLERIGITTSVGKVSSPSTPCTAEQLYDLICEIVREATDAA